MTKKIALLHTSMVFILRERLVYDILNELLPDVEITNLVDDTMLKEVMATGVITPEITRRMCHMVLAAEAVGVDAIFSTCSSLGPTINIARKLVRIPIVKIDEGMAEKAAREGKQIGVMATVPTTLQPTIDLIQEKSVEQGSTIKTQPNLCAGAFELLNLGKRDEHDAMVIGKAKEVARWADTIVLAQCSMARLAPRLQQETGITVLSSPRLGVEWLKQVLGD
jgi:Asp/Glu/hydantoin racemase